MRITPEMLKTHHFHEDQHNLFLESHPDGVELTEELCVKYAEDFNFILAAYCFLTFPQLQAFLEMEEPHKKIFREATAPHHKAYKEAEAPHKEKLEAGVAALEKAFKGAIALRLGVFRAKQTMLWWDYNAAMAPYRKTLKDAVDLCWKPRAEAMARNFFRASQL